MLNHTISLWPRARDSWQARSGGQAPGPALHFRPVLLRDPGVTLVSRAPEVVEIVKESRNIPRRVAEEGIRSIPDCRVTDGGFAGEGWHITLQDLPPLTFGYGAMCRIRFVLRGREEVLRRVWYHLLLRLPGGGG